MPQQNDTTLRDRAKKRVGFKLHIVIALGGNAVMWLIYYLTWTGYPWPLWFLAGSLVSLFIHWLAIFSGIFSTEKEYERLRHTKSK